MWTQEREFMGACGIWDEKIKGEAKNTPGSEIFAPPIAEDRSGEGVCDLIRFDQGKSLICFASNVSFLFLPNMRREEPSAGSRHSVQEKREKENFFCHPFLAVCDSQVQSETLPFAKMEGRCA